MRVESQSQADALEFNPYEILGVRKWASLKEIKRAYFGLVRKYSPELFPEKFIEIRKAYDSLRFPQRRAKVDILIFNEIRGNIGFRGVAAETGSVVKLNKAIKDLESKGWEKDSGLRKKILILLQKRSLVYVSKNYWHEAISEWNRILEFKPDSKEAGRNIIQGYGRLGYSYAQNGLLKKAIQAWKEILNLNPSCVEAAHNIAIASTRLKDSLPEKEYWEKTLELWSEKLESDSDNEYLKNLIVETHKYFGGRFIVQKKESRPQVKKQQEVLGQIGGYAENLQLGMACMNGQNWDQAIRAFEKCLTERPEDVEILNALGWAYLNLNQSNRAFATWNRALKINPKNQSTLGNLVQGHLTIGKNLRTQKAFGPALVHFKSILKVMPNQPEVYMEIGNTYYMKGDLHSAIEHWQTVLTLDPKNKLAQQAVREAKNRARSS